MFQKIKGVGFELRVNSAVLALVLATFSVTASNAAAQRYGNVRTQDIDMVVIHST